MKKYDIQLYGITLRKHLPERNNSALVLDRNHRIKGEYSFMKTRALLTVAAVAASLSACSYMPDFGSSSGNQLGNFDDKPPYANERTANWQSTPAPAPAPAEPAPAPVMAPAPEPTPAPVMSAEPMVEPKVTK